MSKIGKININIPDKVKVALNGNNVNIEGPLGKKTLNIDLNIFDLNISEGSTSGASWKIIFLPKPTNLWSSNLSNNFNLSFQDAACQAGNKAVSLFEVNFV